MCEFCNIIEGKQKAYILSETEKTIAFLDMDPINEGHVLIVPKYHADSIDLIPQDVLQVLMSEAQKVTKILKQTYNAPGYGIMQNGGEFCDFGHFHLHVFPRYKDDGFGFTYPEGKFEYSGEVLDKLKGNLPVDTKPEYDGDRFRKQLAFALEIDKEKEIYRQTHLSNHGRSENDSEHAWHMAIMAYLMKEYSNVPVDIKKVMIMCLLHDVVEIDAGDTYAYDAEGLKTQKEREDKAKERIFSLLPEDQKEELLALVNEFDDNKSAEAKFAHCMDNVQPLMLNDSNGGSDWIEHGVTATQIKGRQGKNIEGSEYLFKYTDDIIRRHVREGHIKE